MEIIGTGFIARHLRPLAGAHPDATVLAAGVPLPENPDSEYARETALVDETIERCLAANRLLVFFSTAAVGLYGGRGCQGREDVPIEPPTDYGRHKLALEQRIQRSGVRHLTLRLTYVVGPHGRDDRLIPALIQQILSGSVTVYQGARRDLLDVADLVQIIDQLLASGVSNEVINVASGESVPVSLIIDHIEARLGVFADRRFVQVDAPHWVSVEKLRRILPSVTQMGFGPTYYQKVIDRYFERSGLVGRSATDH
nr:NAD-dependent epimerase/dehydratase family protein [Micromonospora sp. DSM 115978]